MLALKFAGMRENVYRFYRGSCALFSEDFPQPSFFAAAPAAWQCGDLHLENFGSFKGDNGLAYFDINDFDEALLAPCVLDVSRLACSIFVSAPLINLSPAETRALAEQLLQSYAEALTDGSIRMIEKETARGMTKELLCKVTLRRKKEFLRSRTEKVNGERVLAENPLRIIRPDKAAKKKLIALMHQWAGTQPDPGFYEIKDAALRIAGTGSLGLERYVLLAEGKGGLSGNVLLDLKEAHPSAASSLSIPPRRKWSCEAERVLEIQRRMQCCPPALLHLVNWNGKSFVLKALQPSEDKIAYRNFAGKTEKLGQQMNTLGKLCAWSVLRSAGREGSENADALIAFGKNATRWKQPLLGAAEKYATQVGKDYADYQRDYDKGLFAKKYFLP